MGGGVVHLGIREIAFCTSIIGREFTSVTGPEFFSVLFMVMVELFSAECFVVYVYSEGGMGACTRRRACVRPLPTGFDQVWTDGYVVLVFLFRWPRDGILCVVRPDLLWLQAISGFVPNEGFRY